MAKTRILTILICLTALLAEAEESKMQFSPKWEYVADTVMGGVSTGKITVSAVGIAQLTGVVSLDNNGGFVQMAFNLAPDGRTFDASAFEGIEIEVRGNNEIYDLRLRTDELLRPWHSFRTEFAATSDWQTLRIPFTDFKPHRTEVALDPARLRRIGVLAIGRVFDADVSVGRIALY